MTAPVPAVEISAVMPAYNEEANLEQSVGRMVAALGAQAARERPSSRSRRGRDRSGRRGDGARGRTAGRHATGPA